MIPTEDIPTAADNLVRHVHSTYPHMELFEIGALLLSAGCFLTASSIPELWPRLRGTAELSHELLLNEKTKEKLYGKAE